MKSLAPYQIKGFAQIGIMELGCKFYETYSYISTVLIKTLGDEFFDPTCRIVCPSDPAKVHDQICRISSNKHCIIDMNIVVTDSYVLDLLKEVLSEHTRSLQQGGDRVCVKLEGAKLEMTAAMVRVANEDIMNQLPRQARSNYFLVESAKIVEAQTALESI